jgi:hypothetical protein
MRITLLSLRERIEVRKKISHSTVISIMLVSKIRGRAVPLASGGFSRT